MNRHERRRQQRLAARQQQQPPQQPPAASADANHNCYHHPATMDTDAFWAALLRPHWHVGIGGWASDNDEEGDNVPFDWEADALGTAIFTTEAAAQAAVAHVNAVAQHIRQVVDLQFGGFTDACDGEWVGGCPTQRAHSTPDGGECAAVPPAVQIDGVWYAAPAGETWPGLVRLNAFGQWLDATAALQEEWSDAEDDDESQYFEYWEAKAKGPAPADQDHSRADDRA